MCFGAKWLIEKRYVTHQNQIVTRIAYATLTKTKESKQESDVRSSVESPKVRTERLGRQISLGVKEEGTLLVIEICPGTTCLVLQRTPAVRVVSTFVYM